MKSLLQRSNGGRERGLERNAEREKRRTEKTREVNEILKRTATRHTWVSIDYLVITTTTLAEEAKKELYNGSGCIF
jgi:hypothetical protein